MADVYFDEDVWLALAADFRAHNHDVATYRDYGLTRASDALHHLTATQQQRVLITFNREDYELLHDAWHYWTAAWNTSNQHSGIIVADQTVPRPVHAVSIHSLLSSDLPLANRLYEWRGGRNGGWYAISNGNGRRCLHSWMASKDLSWGETALGKLLGIPQPHVSRLELREHSPTLEMLQRLAMTLGLRFIVEVAPTDKSSAGPLSLPQGMEVVQDVTTPDDRRVRVATS